LSIVTAVVAAAVGLGGLWIRHRELADGESRRILRDIKILRSLPESSAVFSKLIGAIDDSVLLMLTNRTTKGRNWANVGIGISLLAFTVGGGLLVARGGWWWVLAPLVLFALVFGLYGTIEGSIKAERDARGNITSSNGPKQEAGPKGPS